MDIKAPNLRSYLRGNSLLPDRRGAAEHMIAQISPEVRARLDKANVELWGNIRRFLEEHCDIKGAFRMEISNEELRRRMEIANIEISHVTVAKKPQLSGTWILKRIPPTGMFAFAKRPDYKPLVCFPDRRMKDGKMLPQLMIRLQSDTIKIVGGVQVG